MDSHLPRRDTRVSTVAGPLSLALCYLSTGDQEANGGRGGNHAVRREGRSTQVRSRSRFTALQRATRQYIYIFMVRVA